MGNLILIYSSLIPLFILIFALSVNQPHSITIKRLEKEMAAYVDNDLTLSFNIDISDGLGFITVADTLPQYFKLVDGSNFRVLWKGLRKKSQLFSYKVKCTRRGVYSLGPIKWETRHPLLLKQSMIGTIEEPLKLIVKHKPFSVRRMRSVRTLSKIPLPLGSSAKMGITTTDFREIRDYLPGDSYRSINWKVTARQLPRREASPLKVNEFEREGKKVVWIFLDKTVEMALGPIVKTPFEYAVQAATGIARFYLERDCRVGLCIYGSKGAERIIFPEVGGRQYYKVLRGLIGAEVELEDKLFTVSPLKDAIRKCRGHLVGNKPLTIIVTTITPKNFRLIIEGIKEIEKYITQVRYRSRQIIVVNLIGYHIAARDYFEETAANILELRNQQIIREVRKAGASVITWNPLRQSLAELLLAGLRIT